MTSDWADLGGAHAADVEALINLCREEVQTQFGIGLEPEVIILGTAPAF